MKLTHLNQVAEAFEIVRETCSAQGAETVAKYCIDNKDYSGAIEFMLLANRSEDAFNLAQNDPKGGLMEAYTNCLDDRITVEDARRVAIYYEKKTEFGKAGK